VSAADAGGLHAAEFSQFSRFKTLSESPVVDRSQPVDSGNVSAHDFQPPPDPVIASMNPFNLLRSCQTRVGECADTTITSITDRFGGGFDALKKGV